MMCSKCKTEEEIKFCRDSQPGITRQEAIYRMAKALYIEQYGKNRPSWEDEDNGYKEIYLRRAEAALKALLSMEK